MVSSAWCKSLETDGNPLTTAGVYVGCMYHEYVDVLAGSGSPMPPQAFIGSGAPYMVGRLSYTFDFSGPCVSTDTACSSSLVATHLACRAICHGETPAAISGGVNAMLLPQTTAGISQLQALSPVGRCRYGCRSNEVVQHKTCLRHQAFHSPPQPGLLSMLSLSLS